MVGRTETGLGQKAPEAKVEVQSCTLHRGAQRRRQERRCPPRNPQVLEGNFARVRSYGYRWERVSNIINISLTLSLIIQVGQAGEIRVITIIICSGKNLEIKKKINPDFTKFSSKQSRRDEEYSSSDCEARNCSYHQAKLNCASSISL